MVLRKYTIISLLYGLLDPHCNISGTNPCIVFPLSKFMSFSSLLFFILFYFIFYFTKVFSHRLSQATFFFFFLLQNFLFVIDYVMSLLII